MLLNEWPEGPRSLGQPAEHRLFCKVDCLKWLGLELRLGRMCRKVDHVNVNLPTHSTIPPATFRHSQRCNSRPCTGRPSAAFDLTGVDAARLTRQGST